MRTTAASAPHHVTAARAGLLPPSEALTLRRLLYFGRIVAHFDSELWSLLAADDKGDSWLAALRADLVWLSTHLPGADLPGLGTLNDWAQAIQCSPRAWKSLVARAKRNRVAQLGALVTGWDMHRTLTTTAHAFGHCSVAPCGLESGVDAASVSKAVRSERTRWSVKYESESGFRTIGWQPQSRRLWGWLMQSKPSPSCD